MYKQITFNDFNEKNSYVRYFITLKEVTYIFTLRWNFYCDCGFISIADYENSPIISSKALTNGLQIRNNKLPYVLYFRQINGETYEPTIENIATEFVLLYNDEAEIQ